MISHGYFCNDEVGSQIQGRNHFIFDLNGLLLDDEPLQLRATNAAFSDLGLSISPAVWREECVGHKPLEYLPNLLATNIITADSISRRLAVKDAIYQSLINESGASLVRPGVQDFLKYLKSSHMRVTLCTSTTRAGVEAVLQNSALGIGSFVDAIVCGDDVIRSKPEPEIYLKALDGGDPKRSIAFEDARPGLLSAVAAGIDCIVCPNEFTVQQNFSEAKASITDFTELARLTN